MTCPNWSTARCRYIQRPATRVARKWRYVYRAVDHLRQVVDVYVFPRRAARAARRFFAKAIKATGTEPAKVVTGPSLIRASSTPSCPGAFHNTKKHANNRAGIDHGGLKARLRPMRGLQQDQSARLIIPGHALGTEHAPRSLRARCQGVTEATTGGRLRRIRTAI